MAKLSRRQIAAPLIYVAASAAFVVLVGVPYQRDLLAIWLLLGLLCFSMSDLRGFGRGVVLEWLPFIAILIAYDSLRGSAAHTFGVHYLPQLRVDEALFGGTAPTVTLQHWLWHGHVVWYDVPVWAVYLTHFFATPLVAAVLWKLDRPRFRMVRGARRGALVRRADHLRAVPGRASVDGQPGRPDGADHADHPRRVAVPGTALRRLAGRARLPVRQQRRRGAVAARRVLAADRDHAVAAQAQVAAPDRGPVPAGDGVFARLRRRALLLGHPARLDLHGGHRVRRLVR